VLYLLLFHREQRLRERASIFRLYVHYLSWSPTSLFSSYVGPHLTSEHQNLQKSVLYHIEQTKGAIISFFICPFQVQIKTKIRGRLPY